MNKLPKETKKQRKSRVGMNHVTASNFKQGASLPQFAPPQGIQIGVKLIPAFAKIKVGVPYVNASNFT
jgi:hypothetical protein